MSKIKKSIASFVTLALVWTSLPWTAAANVQLARPVGTQVGGVAGSSPASRIQLAVDVASLSTELSRLPSFSALQTGSPSSVEAERLAAFTREASALIDGVVTRPDATPVQIKAGNAIKEALLAKNYPTDLQSHSAVAQALAELRLDTPGSLDVLYDWLRAFDAKEAKVSDVGVSGKRPEHDAGIHPSGLLLENKNYAVIPASRLIGNRAEALRSEVAASFDRLKEDRYYPESAPGKRYRAAARIEVRPDAAMAGGIRIQAFPGASFQDTAGEAHYPGIEPTVLQDGYFQALVGALAAQLPEGARRNGVQIGVHQIRVVDGQATPEGLHQDDFADSIAIWVVNRGNVVDGQTKLAQDSKGNRAVMNHVLTPGEILLLDNHKLWHEVLPFSRKNKEFPAVRDVFVFSMSTLPSAIRSIPSREETQAIHLGRQELMKPKPDTELLRRIYESGNARVRTSLYRAFKTWSRYFSRGGQSGQQEWAFIKSAAAPWAGRVYIKRLKSFLEILAEQQDKKINAEQEAKKIHQADNDFADSFVKAAEAQHPQGLDEDEAAELISDAVVYPLVIQRLLEKRQVGKFNREELLNQMAQTIKDTVYLYLPDMTVEKISELLKEKSVQDKFAHFLDLVEQYIPGEPPHSGSSGESASSSQPTIAQRLMSNGNFLVLLAAVGYSVYSYITGAPFHDGQLFLAGATMAAVPTDTAQPAREETKKPYLVDLTAKARRGELSPTYLRDAEVGKVIRVLNQTAYNNVFLIGEPGVGKTAIAEGVAQFMAHGDTHTPLDEQRMLLLDVGKFLSIAAGSPDRFAKEVVELVQEVSDGNTVLMIDEAHQLAKDPATGTIQTSFYDQIKQAMTKGDLKLILATTRSEYKKYFASDAALESRGQVIPVEPVAEGPAKALLYRPDIRNQFEKGVEITYQAAEAAVELTVRAFRFKALLRMAIQALDTAATGLRNRPAEVKRRLLSTRKDLLYHLDLLRQARMDKDFARQENVIRIIQPLLQNYVYFQAEWIKPRRTKVGREDVEEALQEMGAPLHALRAGTKEHLENTERFLRANLIGHGALISQTALRLKARFADPNSRQPILSALLLGATGTGKTEYARLLGRALWNIEDVEKSVIKYNGGDLQEKHRMSIIQGAPPGYVGFKETETLMDRVRRNPQSVILIDEVEKMHPDILNIFLSILDDGAANDSEGKPVDFSNTIIVFTSNFGVPKGEYENLSDGEFRSQVEQGLKTAASPFKPEFLNRLNVVDVFTPLKEMEVRQIVELGLKQIEERWRVVHGVQVDFEDRENMVGALLKEGYSRRNGARAMKRVISQRIEDPLNSRLIDLKLQRGDKAYFRSDGSLEIVKAPEDNRTPVLAAATAEGQALADKLESLLGSLKPEEPLTVERLDEVLDGAVPQGLSAWFHPRAVLDNFAPEYESEPMKEHRPPHIPDPALKEALSRLKGKIKDEAKAQEVIRGVKALVYKAKRINLEATFRDLKGAGWNRSFAEMEQAVATQTNGNKRSTQQILENVLQKANADKRVVLGWQVRDDNLRVQVALDSRIPYDEEIRMGESLGNGVLENSSPSPDNDLIELKNAVIQAGGRLGYSKDDQKSTLWVEWPMHGTMMVEQEAAITEGSHSESATTRIAAVKREAKAVQGISVTDQGLRLLRYLLDPQTKFRVVAQGLDQLASLIKDNPTAVSSFFEETIRVAIKTFLKEVSKRKVEEGDSYDVHITKIDAADIAKVDGKFIPIRRIRGLFDLYEQLAAVRPDLVSKEMKDIILAGLRSNVFLIYDRQVFDPEGNSVALWAVERLTAIGRVISQKCPDIIRLSDFPIFYKSVEDQKDNLRKVEDMSGYILGFVVFFTITVGFIWTIENIVSVPIRIFGMALIFLADIIFANSWRSFYVHRNSKDVKRILRLVVQMFHQRALVNSPEDVLDVIGSVEENEKWGPQKGFEKLFDELQAQWPEFRATVANGFPVSGHQVPGRSGK